MCMLTSLHCQAWIMVQFLISIPRESQILDPKKNVKQVQIVEHRGIINIDKILPFIMQNSCTNFAGFGSEGGRFFCF